MMPSSAPQGFWNPPLAPRKNYNIYLQAVSSTERVNKHTNHTVNLKFSPAACCCDSAHSKRHGSDPSSLASTFKQLAHQRVSDFEMPM